MATETTLASAPLLAGRYAFEGELGRGASGRVLRVRDRSANGALRAAKVLDDPAHGARAALEFAHLAAVSDPGVAAVFDLVSVAAALPAPFRLPAGAVVLVEALAEGVTADRAIRAVAPTDRPRWVLAVVLGAARGLAAIHQAGLVHGDVQPRNLVVAGDGALPTVTLVDLGLADRPGGGPAGALRGTPAFLAPEVFRGERGLAADLYGLGATAHALLAMDGDRPGAAGGETGGASSTGAGLAHRPRPVEELPAWVPGPVRRLLAELLAPDPADRPETARAVAARAAAALHGLGVPVDLPAGLDDEPTPAERAARVLGLPLVGRDAARDALVAAIEEVGVALVRGPPGAGRSRLVREAVGAVQRRAVEAGRPSPTYLASLHGGAADATVPGADGAAVVHHVPDGPEARGLARAALVDPSIRVVLEAGPASTPPPGVPAIDLGPLADADLERLLAAVLGAPGPDAAWLDAARRVSGGLPGRLCRALAALRDEGARPSELAAVAADAAGDDPAALDLALAGRAGRQLAGLLAAAGGVLPASVARRDDGARDPAPTALRDLGAVTVDARGDLRLRDDLVARAPAAAPGALEAALAATPAAHPARPFLLAALGRPGEAAVAARAVADALREAGEPERAADLLGRLGDRLPPGEAAALLAVRADALRAAGRAAEGRALLEGTAAAGSQAPAALRAELERLVGDLSAARATADAASRGGDLAARAVLARVAFDAGDVEGAGTHAQAVLDDGGAPGAARARAAEVLALRAWARQDLAEAEVAAARCLEAARLEGSRAALARARSLQAMVALGAHRPVEARRLYGEALSHAEAAGERAAAAADLANLGAARKAEGDLGPALELLRSAARRYARLDAPQLPRVLVNLASVAAVAGDDDVARSALRAAEAAAAARAPDPRVARFADLVRVDLALREAGPAAALPLAEAMVGDDAGEAVLDPEASALGLARRAEVRALAGRVSDARADAEGASALADRAGSDLAAAEACLAHARVAVAAGDAGAARDAARRGCALAERAGNFEVSLRAHLVAADVADAAADAAWAGEARARTRELLDRAMAGLSPAGRARLRRVRAYRSALATAPAPAPDGSGRQGGVDDRWRRLAQVARRLAAERRVPRLRETLVDVAVDLLGAERGWFLERDERGGWTARVAKRLDGVSLDGEADGFSTSIAARAHDEGHPIRTVDAAADERLGELDSVHALALRSVVAAPIRTRGERASAVLYLEDRLRPAAFDRDDLALLADLCELGAITLDAARAFRTERSQRRRLAALRRELERTVEAQALELDSVRRTASGTGEEFEGIVATSPAMRDVLDLVRRVARSELPVLITGESGTGKELVARALHARSLRANRRFVGESCAAIPDTLLESALFGHVKGAFTGADRSRVGLFEAADGGTLFLDEIGEMSPAMQSRLLRAVQEGEVRPVGGERTRKVDVRFLAATHRDLGEMVAEGTFREDLYYRLAVVVVRVPPLRERPDDVEPLVAHLVARHAPGRSIRVDRRVLDRFATHAWPGNVRQLENEVQRALVLADDVIRLEHLSPALRGEGAGSGGAEPAAGPGPFDLKGQVACLERRLIEEALERCEGNQTRAARLLGVSRYGLQKMMKRLEV